MKSFIILLAGGVVLITAMIVYFSRQDAPPTPEPVAEVTSGKITTRPEEVVVPREEPTRAVSQDVDEPAQVEAIIPAASDAIPERPVNAAPPSTPFSQAIDTLISGQTSFSQKQAAWGQLRDAGQLDQAIEALELGATENPTSAVYPATLGQAQLQKAGVIAQTGGKISEMGMLGMQADQNFDAALTLDPANWEAQFFKAAAMSHWPPELNKGEEVIQRLASLIDQQETSPSEPQFAQTYVLLGDQYQKMNQPDYAATTWQIGAQKFPGDPTLQERIWAR